MEYDGLFEMFENGAMSLNDEGYAFTYSDHDGEEEQLNSSNFPNLEENVSTDNTDNEDAFYNDGLHEMTEEEDRQYSDQLRKSGGFDVTLLPNVCEIGIIQPLDLTRPSTMKDMNDFASEDVREYNRRYEGGLKLVKVLKAMCEVVCFANYYLTFEATEASDMGDSAKSKIYQAVVLEKISGDSEVLSFRLKTIEDEEGESRSDEENGWFWVGYCC